LSRRVGARDARGELRHGCDGTRKLAVPQASWREAGWRRRQALEIERVDCVERVESVAVGRERLVWSTTTVRHVVNSRSAFPDGLVLLAHPVRVFTGLGHIEAKYGGRALVPHAYTDTGYIELREAVYIEDFAYSTIGAQVAVEAGYHFSTATNNVVRPDGEAAFRLVRAEGLLVVAGAKVPQPAVLEIKKNDVSAAVKRALKENTLMESTLKEDESTRHASKEIETDDAEENMPVVCEETMPVACEDAKTMERTKDACRRF
jgi:hypothetical protein